jgi:hypothetical protein
MAPPRSASARQSSLRLFAPARNSSSSLRCARARYQILMQVLARTGNVAESLRVYGLLKEIISRFVPAALVMTSSQA